jgi:molecular chaperone GrpE
MTEEPIRHEEPEVAESSGEEDRAAALEDRLLRLAAEFDNYKKRVAREQARVVTLANERLVK